LARTAAKQAHLQSLGIVDEIAMSVPEACQDCDVVVIAAPVDRIAELVLAASAASPPSCLITDVGSTKAGIVAAVSTQAIARDKFVAAHPIAGSEKTGPEHARANLFDGKPIVLTPDAATDRALLEKADRFWRLTGGYTREMQAGEHDAHLAAISHVPHLVSALVARMAHPQARPLVGSGWTDMTRIAAGDPELWTAICRENREAIREELQRVAEELRDLRQIVDDHDDEALRSWLAEAQRVRQQSP
jgi:prephenate dehydrogenase